MNDMYSPKDYWSSLADGFDSMDASGFAPILHPFAPSWFNKFIDDLQFRALRRALALASIQPGARFLDVGCGTGRWVRRYGELGFSVVGSMRPSACYEFARVPGNQGSPRHRISPKSAFC